MSLNPSSPPLDMITSPEYSSPPSITPPAKESRPNSSEIDDTGISGPKSAKKAGISDAKLAELFRSFEERSEKRWKAVFAEAEPEPESRLVDPIYCPETLPEGYAWGSYMSGSEIKKVAYQMCCFNCGKNAVHMTDKCPDQDSEEAKEFRRRLTKGL